MTSTLSTIQLQERGVFVQASTLGSLEALLTFLKQSKIPVRSCYMPYSGKLLREKTFVNVAVLRKFSLQNLGVWCPLVRQREQSVKVFSAKIVFFTNTQKVSSSKVSHYTVLILASFITTSSERGENC